MTHDPLVGKVIDNRYEIQTRVGEGGMGVVYKARQISIDRVIAVKLLNAQMAADPNWVQRFYNEAKACSRLQHPNTIRMFDFGQTTEGRLFMTMEFLDGISLRDAVAKGPLTPNRVMKIMIQCCASLAEAHSIGIIHRDIKPDNVFLLNMAGSPDFVKLLDFSVAKLLEGDRMKTQAGVVFGTPQYMSPEQGRGGQLDARSDLYALGILAYEMLTGNVPFNDDNPMTVIQMHLKGEIPPMADSIPYSVQQVVRRALEKDAARRYQSAGEMMQHCQQVFAELAGGGVAIGGGGVPKTVVAGPGQLPPGLVPQAPYAGHGQHMQQPPQQQPPPQGGYVAASAQQKTMIAGMSPFAPGGPMQQLQGPGGFQPPGGMQPQGGFQPPGGMQPQGGFQPPGAGGFQPSGSNQKTMVAGMAPQIPGQGMQQPGMMQPGMQGGMQPPGMQPPGGGSPNKTIMLQPSEGVVSVARTGSALQPVTEGATSHGATPLFWVVSLLIGIAAGAGAYLAYLQLL